MLRLVKKKGGTTHLLSLNSFPHFSPNLCNYNIYKRNFAVGRAKPKKPLITPKIHNFLFSVKFQQSEAPKTAPETINQNVNNLNTKNDELDNENKDISEEIIDHEVPEKKYQFRGQKQSRKYPKNPLPPKVVTLDTTIRLDTFLTQQKELQKFSRTTLQKFIKEKKVTVDEKIIDTSSHHLKENQKVSISIEPLEFSALNTQSDKNRNLREHILPQPLDVPIIYEDSDIIVVNKPKGMLVHPTARSSMRDTLVNFLLYYCNSTNQPKSSGSIEGIKRLSKISLSDVTELNRDGLRPGIVHRIDKDTSGLLIIAKNNSSHTKLYEQFKDQVVKKKYLCLCKGIFTEKEGTIRSMLTTNYPKRNSQVVNVSEPKEQEPDWQYCDGLGEEEQEDEQVTTPDKESYQEIIEEYSKTHLRGTDVSNIPFYHDFDDSDTKDDIEEEDGVPEKKEKIGKLAVSAYKVLEEFSITIPDPKSKKKSNLKFFVSLVEVEISSGRTHQIRSQLHSFGHSILFDPTYRSNAILKTKSTRTCDKYVSPSLEELFLLGLLGRSTQSLRSRNNRNKEKDEPVEFSESMLYASEAELEGNKGKGENEQKNKTVESVGQLLHANSIEFTHPKTGELLSFNSPFPPIFESYLEILRSNSKATK